MNILGIIEWQDYLNLLPKNKHSVYLVLYILFLVITLLLLWKNQRHTDYIRLGWFFTILTFFYYGFPIIYLNINPDYSIKVLNRFFDDEFLEYCTIVLLVCQCSFFFGELLTSNIHRQKTCSIIKPISNKLITVLLILVYVLFFMRWNAVGGFSTIIELNRNEYINEAAASSIFSRYDIILNIVSLFLAINVSIVKEYIRNNKILFFSYFLFLILTLLMGTRLLMVNYTIGFLCVIFFLNRNILLNRLKTIFLSVFILAILLTLYQTVRLDVVDYFASGTFNIDENKISLVPAEFFTGLLSEHSIKRGMNFQTEFTYFFRMIPSSILEIMGVNDYKNYAVEIADKSRFTSGRVVYTIPYTFDVYHGVGNNLFLLFIVSTMLYLIFYHFINYFSKTNIFIFLSTYFLIYNVFRAENSIWFSKIYLTIFFILLLNFLFKLNKKHHLIPN